MKRKVVILISILLALCCVVFGIVGVYKKFYKQKEYRCDTYSKEELKSLFEEHRELFLQLPRIMETQYFWEECRPNEDELHAFISSPYDEKKLSVFSQSEKEKVIRFFKTLKPYMISVDHQKYLRITFISSNQSDATGYNIFYLYSNERGDKYPLNGQKPSQVSDVVDFGKEYIYLDNGWGMY